MSLDRCGKGVERRWEGKENKVMERERERERGGDRGIWGSRREVMDFCDADAATEREADRESQGRRKKIKKE